MVPQSCTGLLFVTLAVCSSVLLLAGAQDVNSAAGNGDVTAAQTVINLPDKDAAPRRCKCIGHHRHSRCYVYTGRSSTAASPASFGYDGSTCRCSGCGNAPVNADSVCKAGACTFACKAGFIKCGSVCINSQNKDDCYTQGTGPTPPGDITPTTPAVLQNSLLAAQLAELAYPDKSFGDTNTNPDLDKKYQESLTDKLAAKGLATVGFVSRWSWSSGVARFLQAYIAAAPAAPGKVAAVYVVLRGTDGSSAAVSTDLESGQKAIPDWANSAGVLVHGGFLLSLTEKPGWMYNSQAQTTSAYEDIKKQVAAAFALAGVGPAASVNVIGHSLGGAEAALCAYLLRVEGVSPNIFVYTFGMPQVGNEAWRSAFNKQLGAAHFRWWNKKDPVAQIPNSKSDPGSWWGTQYWFTTETLFRIDVVNDVLKCGIPSGQYAACDDRDHVSSKSCYTDVNFNAAFASADHSMTVYKDNLGKCCAAQGVTCPSA